jgi:G2/mitotic-specific cyclin 3/4
MQVVDNETAPVQEAKVGNGSNATRQPVGEQNRVKIRPQQSNEKSKQTQKIPRYTATTPVQQPRKAISVPKTTIETRQELEAARIFVEESRTKQDEIYDQHISLVAEYGADIFEHLRSLEQLLKPKKLYIDHQPKSFWHMRSVLINWLVTVHDDCGLLHEIIFLAVNYFDRFLSRNKVKDCNLKLIGATSLLLATKYEDDDRDYGELKEHLVDKADGAFTDDALLNAELHMFGELEYALGWPGPMSFLRRISRADGYEVYTHTLSKYFLDITVMDKHFVGCVPSFLSAGAYYLSRLMLEEDDWVSLSLFSQLCRC